MRKLRTCSRQIYRSNHGEIDLDVSERINLFAQKSRGTQLK